MPLLLWQRGGHLTTAQLEIRQDIKANFSPRDAGARIQDAKNRLTCL